MNCKHLLIIAMALLAACSGMTGEQKAAEEARDYYTLLTDGERDVDGFLQGRDGYDSLPADYQRQLKDATEMFLRDIEKRHRGLTTVTLSDNEPRRDSTLGIVYTFVLLGYADSTAEEIVVPMVERSGGWKMKN